MLHMEIPKRCYHAKRRLHLPGREKVLCMHCDAKILILGSMVGKSQCNNCGCSLPFTRGHLRIETTIMQLKNQKKNSSRSWLGIS